MTELSLNDIVGRGYATVWQKLHDEDIRYIAIKGSRASKKSKTTALFLILLMLENPQTNALVLRRYERTLRDSCFQDLMWATARLGVEMDFEFLKSPLEIRRRSTGQKILMRGLDDGLKVTSIAVSKGVLCYCWCEEAYELKSDEEFNKVDLSFRGAMPVGISPKFIFTFNPWSEQSFLKSRFFDSTESNIYSLTTNYKINEWLSDNDLKLFEDLRKNHPRRYSIEGLGEWGISEGLIYENNECKPVDIDELRTHPAKYKAFYGLDFGFTDPTAFVGGFTDLENKIIYVCWELYLNNVTNQDIAREIKDLGLHGEPVMCDSARL